jgi:SAM-dependent methyltransferase
MSEQIQTWHKGLVARWWAEFRLDGPDLDYYHSVVSKAGEPVLDLGCGTGRLLLPWLRAGMDVTGVDVAPDMLKHCREVASVEQLHPRLYCQAMHDLHLNQQFKTIILCGAFGIGGNRAQDQQALERCFAHLLPGGTIALDHELPSAMGGWRSWQNHHKPDLPSPWSNAEDRRVTADGSELVLNTRVLEFDPLTQATSREIRVEHWRDGELLESESWPIRLNIYFRNELVNMLKLAGFEQIQVKGDFTDEDARPYVHRTLVYLGRKPSVN